MNPVRFFLGGLRVVIFGGCFALSCLSQTLQIVPAQALADEAVQIAAAGLQSGEHVTLRAELLDGDNHPWESYAEFAADAEGKIDLATQAPVKGSYKSVSSMGLIWSMMPAIHGVEVYRPPAELGPQLIRFTLLRGKAVIATAQLQQDALAQGVRQIEVTGVIQGVLFVPPGNAPNPGLLVLGGSEGGMPRRHAALLASHGYAALSLAYFRFGDLPQRLEGIPLEYFGRALGWMRTRPEISPEKIAVVGVSRGGELALQLGALYPQIKAVVAYVPADVRHGACCGGTSVPYAWTLHGQPLAFARFGEHGADELRAVINVNNIHGPIFLVGGSDDGVWDSGAMVSTIDARLKHKHFPYEVEALIYPHAGHIAGRDQIAPEWHGLLRHPISGRPVSYGGTPEGNAESSLDAIPKVLAFLLRNLGNVSTQ